MSGPASRRGFLSGLVSLPLIGGGVTLIGSPSAVAEPASRDCLGAYSEWLRIERIVLLNELYPQIEPRARRLISEAPIQQVEDFFIPPCPASWQDMPKASTRAALVLSAVGCDWREGGR